MNRNLALVRMALTLADRRLNRETRVISGRQTATDVLRVTTDAFKDSCRELACLDGVRVRDVENALLAQAAEMLA